LGVDFYGKAPSTKKGKYYQNSWWSWCPLVEYIFEVAPDIASHCAHLDIHDGEHGLDARGRLRLPTNCRQKSTIAAALRGISRGDWSV
jgi:hypothetical protein